MRYVFGIVAILVVVGTAALYYSFTRGEFEEWQPARLPYPGIGFSAQDTFRLHRGGRFAFHVLSPCTAPERDAAHQDEVATRLHVVINGSHSFRIDKLIGSMSVCSWRGLERSFCPNDVWVLPPGEYQILVEASNPIPPVFRERGAVVYLKRMEPVGPDLGIQLSGSLGYFLLAVAALITGWMALRKSAIGRGA